MHFLKGPTSGWPNCKVQIFKTPSFIRLTLEGVTASLGRRQALYIYNNSIPDCAALNLINVANLKSYIMIRPFGRGLHAVQIQNNDTFPNPNIYY